MQAIIRAWCQKYSCITYGRSTFGLVFRNIQPTENPLRLCLLVCIIFMQALILQMLTYASTDKIGLAILRYMYMLQIGTNITITPILHMTIPYYMWWTKWIRRHATRKENLSRSVNCNIHTIMIILINYLDQAHYLDRK